MSTPRGVLTVGLLTVLGANVDAQSLERRIAGMGDGSAQFTFAAREGVCGDGRNYLRVDDDGWYGTYTVNGGRETPCTAGPVRVIVTKSGRDIVRIEAQAGPLYVDPTAGQNLGTVGAREAANWLLEQAKSLDGKPAREAIFPAMLADSSVVTPSLVALVRDQNRPRELRRTAITWLSRRRTEVGGVGAATADRTIDQIVRDRTESESIRQSALSTLARLDRGEGTAAMLQFARESDPWLAKQAFSNLSRSGDPRARQFVREAVRRADIQEENRLEALRALGNEYATGADLKVLRELYPASNSDRERDVILSAVANSGGRENATWLLAIANSPTEPVSRRKRVVNMLSKLDDPQIREALKGMVDR
jgi:HEAT repeat protein